MNSLEALETMWQDARYAVRVLRKSPGFTLAAVLSLALGLGANVAVFSVVYAVLLRPLPYPSPNRLVRIARTGDGGSVTMPEFEFWRAHAASLSAVAAHRGSGDDLLVAGAATEWIRTMPVSAGFFATLGVPPVMGRELDMAETRPGGRLAVVIGDRLWRRLFGADPGVIGQPVSLSGRSYIVAGVLPPGFWFPVQADAFVPLRAAGTAEDEGTNTDMVARLKDGISAKQANEEMAALAENFRRERGAQDSSDGQGLAAMGFHEWLAGDVRLTLMLLFGIVAALLLIACSNLASLLLARLATREKEIAVRLALGSGRARLVRQYFVENLLLAAGGCIAGVVAAYWLVDGLVAMMPFKLPMPGPVGLDAPVLGFAVAVALAAAILFSLAPLARTARADLQTALKSAGRAGGGSARQTGRRTLVIAQVALATALLVPAALFIQSLYRMHQERLGFSPANLVTFWTPPVTASFKNAAARVSFEDALLARLNAIPGVKSAAAVNILPLTDQNNFPTEREGHPEQSIGGMEIRLVTPAFFETLGIPVRRGRGVNAGDTASSTPVILVNETLARRWWNRENPVGDHVVVGRFRGKPLDGMQQEAPREVVGVVGDTKTVYLKDPPRPTVYVPSAQAHWMDGGMSWVVRGEHLTGLAEAVRRAVAELDPRQRVERVRSMEEIVAGTTADSRFDAWLCGTFAVVALALTAVGVYGLLAFSVARRTNEIGTRMALGASEGMVLRGVLNQGLALVAAGLGVGLVVAFGITRLLTKLLYGVRATDPASFLTVAAVLLVTGLVASYVPARRATRVDPAAALRCE